MAGTDELACVYAALILSDDQITITSDKIATILKAASVAVEPYWPGLFAKSLDGLNVKELISNVGNSAGSAPVAASAPTAAPVAAGKPAAAEAKKEEKKKEESEESEGDMGFGLFD
uniref:Large ribosomal subunit protein P1 n=1 Tax=Arion vulgaris TaxID=1028688 RepID=A0A0B7BWI8_9EUPU